MMIDTLLAMATYGAGAGALSHLIGRFSPGIKGVRRHMLAGIGPLFGFVSAQIATNEVYVLIGGTMLYGAGLAALGVASSIGVARLEKRNSTRRLVAD